MLFDTTPAGSRFGPNFPTSNVFGVYGGQGNRGTTDFIGYCWHDVPGLQKFGSYESNSGGVFVELGFKPAILVIKNAEHSQQTLNGMLLTQKEILIMRCLITILGIEVTVNLLLVQRHMELIFILMDLIFLVEILEKQLTILRVVLSYFIYMAWAEAPSINLYGAQANAR